jgi:NitT/TauT family transport system ATP-binding protein
MPAGISSGMPAPKLALERVSRSFGIGEQRVEALRDFDLTVEAGTFVTLLGPSGCGKTTVLRLADGLIAPDAGRVLVDGRPPRPGIGTGFVFQSFRLVPWLTVAANVRLPLDLAGMDKSAADERVVRYLALVGLARFAGSYPRQLSGGMKQRAALARALAAEPDILLMDEPFASIDAQARELMQAELMRLWEARRPLVLFVTHSVDEAVLLSDRIVLMSARPGRVEEIVDVGLPRPRWAYDVRAAPEFIRLRTHLWERIRAMVVADPASDFYGRS